MAGAPRLSLGCSGRKMLSVLLVFVPIYLHGGLSQEAGPVGQRKPFFERLRQLEEQFRRFQELTLTHLQGIASNYNVSYNVDAWFQSRAEESQALAQAVNLSQATLQGDLAHMKSWIRKTQHRSRKADTRLRALELTLSMKSRQQALEGKEQKAQSEAFASLALNMQALQDTLAGLTHQVHSQGTRLAALEGQLQMASRGTAAPGLTPAPTPTQPSRPGPDAPLLQRARQALGPSPEHRNPHQHLAACLQGTQKLLAPNSHRTPGGAAAAPKDPPQLAWAPPRSRRQSTQVQVSSFKTNLTSCPWDPQSPLKARGSSMTFPSRDSKEQVVDKEARHQWWPVGPRPPPPPWWPVGPRPPPPPWWPVGPRPAPPPMSSTPECPAEAAHDKAAVAAAPQRKDTLCSPFVVDRGPGEPVPRPGLPCGLDGVMGPSSSWSSSLSSSTTDPGPPPPPPTAWLMGPEPPPAPPPMAPERPAEVARRDQAAIAAAKEGKETLGSPFAFCVDRGPRGPVPCPGLPCRFDGVTGPSSSSSSSSTTDPGPLLPPPTAWPMGPEPPSAPQPMAPECSAEAAREYPFVTIPLDEDEEDVVSLHGNSPMTVWFPDNATVMLTGEGPSHNRCKNTPDIHRVAHLHGIPIDGTVISNHDPYATSY